MPTVEDLKTFYEGEMYQNAVKDFEGITDVTLFDLVEYPEALHHKLNSFQRRFSILNTEFENILLKLENNKDDFLKFATEFLKLEAEKTTIFTFDKTYLLDKIVEFYLLRNNETQKLTNYLQVTQEMYNRDAYKRNIINLYNELFEEI